MKGAIKAEEVFNFEPPDDFLKVTQPSKVLDVKYLYNVLIF